MLDSLESFIASTKHIGFASSHPSPTLPILTAPALTTRPVSLGESACRPTRQIDSFLDYMAHRHVYLGLRMTDLIPLTKAGAKPNRLGRIGVSAAMERLLEEGRRFVDPASRLDPEALRSWTMRLSRLSADLADCVEAPARNRIMELLSAAWIDEEENALRVLRFNIVGASAAQLGDAVDVSGRTIERIESGRSCQVRTAWRLANYFSLRTTELFGGDAAEDRRRCRTVGDLREAMLTPASDRSTTM
jgi:DNA-binding XRE family transcriptional regulator